jgi:hypothetical protein
MASPNPPPRPPEESSAVSTGFRWARWFVLLILFVAIYNFYSRRDPGEDVGPEPARPEASWVEVLGRWSSILIFCAGFAGVVAYTRAVQRWNVLNLTGLNHLEERELQQAERSFTQLWRKGLFSYAATGQYNLGVCKLMAGQPEQALELLTRVEASGKLGSKMTFPGVVPDQISLCHGVLGNVAEARRWLEEAKRRRGELPYDFSLMPESVLLCREGRFDAVVPTVDGRWREAEAAGAGQVKQLRLLKAFALDRLGAEAERAEQLAALKPFRPGEFDYLGTRWPELRAFIESNGLSAPAPSATV